MPGSHPLADAFAIGVDIVEVQRLRGLVVRQGAEVLDRLFTPTEQTSLRGARGLSWDRMAGRFAAKEAVRKVFGSCGESAGFTDIEVHSGGGGEPVLRLLGEATEAAERCGFRRFLLSISHERNAAVAVVIAV